MASAHRRHYAGEVTYHTRGWLDKSRGSLRPNLVRLMQTSECPLLYALPWEVLGELEGGGGSDSVGGGVRLAATTRRTVGMQFAAELRELKSLHSDGSLSDAEFTSAKRQLLGVWPRPFAL